MKTFFKDLIAGDSDYVEIRYHDTTSNGFMAQKGRVDQASTRSQCGVGVRALVDGCWGFSSTSDLSRESLKNNIMRAKKSAKSLAGSRKKKVPELRATPLSTDDYKCEGYDELISKSIEEKIEKVVESEKKLKGTSSLIHTGVARYSEIFENRIFVSSDGACCSRKLVRPEFRVAAYAGQNEEQQVSGRGVGVTGGWECLFNHPSSDKIIEEVAKESVDLLKAPHVEGGRKTVILAPSLVGLLCHEAIGHTVEADFVQSGSVAKDKIGQRVGSDLVNLCDSGVPDFTGGPGGFLPFDDEGVPCRTTNIIENGVLKNYLHNRESAAVFETEARGNARAWSYHDEPLIRMTNTYLMPGESELAQMISEVDDGLLITGAGGGQADATGEFMFGASCAWEIKKGKVGKLFKEVTLSGIAFDVLKTIDAISSEFLWDLGSGHCGKGQPAKVDAGGPYVRCELMVGGRQK